MFASRSVDCPGRRAGELRRLASAAGPLAGTERRFASGAARCAGAAKHLLRLAKRLLRRAKRCVRLAKRLLGLAKRCASVAKRLLSVAKRSGEPFEASRRSCEASRESREAMRKSCEASLETCERRPRSRRTPFQARQGPFGVLWFREYVRSGREPCGPWRPYKGHTHPRCRSTPDRTEADPRGASAAAFSRATPRRWRGRCSGAGSCDCLRSATQISRLCRMGTARRPVAQASRLCRTSRGAGTQAGRLCHGWAGTQARGLCHGGLCACRASSSRPRRTWA